MRALAILISLLAAFSPAIAQTYTAAVVPDAQCPTLGSSSRPYPATFVLCWPSSRVLYFDGVWKERELPLCSDIDDTDPPSGSDCPSDVVCQSKGASTWGVYGCDTAGNWQTIAGSGDGVGYDTVADEGAALTKRATVNFTGAGVTCTDDSGNSRTNCEITGSGGGSAVVLDLGDDGTDESSGITEIATASDTNSIFTEPSPDKLHIDVSKAWPTADLATEVSGTGSTVDPDTMYCPTGSTGSDVAGRMIFDVSGMKLMIGTGTEIAELWAVDGAETAHYLTQGTGSSVWAVPVPDCNATDEALNYDQGTGSWSCRTITGSGGASTLSDLTDTNISTPSAAHMLLYDGTDSWDNKAMSGDATISEAGVVAISSNAVALGTDTTGDYVDGITTGGGLEKTGTEGATLGMLSTCTSDQVLAWNGSAWACANQSSGGGATELSDLSDAASTTPTGGQILIYDSGDNQYENKTMSGDASIAYTGAVTVADDSHAHVITNIDAFTEAQLESQLSDVTDVITGDESIDALGDVDTTTVPPNTGSVLKWNGTNWATNTDTDTNTNAATECSAGEYLDGDGTCKTERYEADTDTTCNDGGVTCLFAAAASEGGAATDVDCTDCVALGTETSGTYVDSPTTGGGLSLGGSGDARSLGLLTSCSTDQILKWNGSAWACADDGGGSSSDSILLWHFTLMDPADGTNMLNLDSGGDTLMGPPLKGAFTVDQVECFVDVGDAGTPTCNIDIGWITSSGTWTDVEAAITVDDDGVSITSGFDDATIPATGKLIGADINSCTSTIKQLTCSIYGTWD